MAWPTVSVFMFEEHIRAVAFAYIHTEAGEAIDSFTLSVSCHEAFAIYLERSFASGGAGPRAGSEGQRTEAAQALVGFGLVSSAVPPTPVAELALVEAVELQPPSAAAGELPPQAAQ